MKVMCLIMFLLKKTILLLPYFHNKITLQYPKASIKKKGANIIYSHSLLEVEYFKSLYDDEEDSVNESERFEGQWSIGSLPKWD